ncbi:MAG: EI24 domain-containing protein [Myxococcota bacterium]
MAELKSAAKVVARPAVGFWTGFMYPFKGMNFVYVQHPKLIKYWIFPILITLITFCAATWGSWHYSDALVDTFWATPEGDGFFDGVARFFHSALAFIFSILLWGISTMLLILLTSIIAAPFNGALSAAVEKIATGRGTGDEGLAVLVRDIGRTIVLEIVKLGLFLLVMIPMFMLQCAAPGVGSILYTIFGFVFTAWYWGLDYVDWPAERRGWKVGQRFANARKRFMPMFGFGTGVWLFLFVPVLNLLFMPAAVAGGTLLFLDMEGPAPETE